MKPKDLDPLLKEHGWAVQPEKRRGAGSRTITVYQRSHDAPHLTHNDRLLVLEEAGEVQVFRLSSRMPLSAVLSGKAPPA